jgi:hypothetical protein
MPLSEFQCKAQDISQVRDQVCFDSYIHTVSSLTVAWQSRLPQNQVFTFGLNREYLYL